MIGGNLRRGAMSNSALLVGRSSWRTDPKHFGLIISGVGAFVNLSSSAALVVDLLGLGSHGHCRLKIAIFDGHAVV